MLANSRLGLDRIPSPDLDPSPRPSLSPNPTPDRPGTLLPLGTDAARARDYINMGVFVFRPSAVVADTLTSAYLSGRFVYCGGSDLSLGNQDVIRHMALETSLLGPFHTWPLCYNYRGWPEQKQCKRKEMYLFHGPRR